MNVFSSFSVRGNHDQQGGGQQFRTLHQRITELEAETASYRETLDRMAVVCQAAAKGDLEVRISGFDADARGADSMHALNQLLDMTDAYVRESRGTLKAASEGRFYRRFMARGLRGSFAQGAMDIDQTRAMMADMEKTAMAERQALADAFEREMIHLVDILIGSVDSLDVMAAAMADNANNTITNAVSAASNAEQTTFTANAVAASSEELSASISEISRQGDYSAEAVVSMADNVQTAQKAVEELEEAAKKVDRVVIFIREIAGQTNLLALNATIEAARAGDAGKGFAVVAGEVKALANQSAGATEDIATQITEMQQATHSTIQSISSIAQQAQDLQAVITSIATAVDEQMQATGEISAHIQQAALGSSEMSTGFSTIRNIAENTGERAQNVLRAVKDMKEHVQAIRAQSTQFLETVRQG